MSTGPTSPAGKRISSQNARKHGLAAESIPEALQPVFNDLRNEHHAQIQPEGTLENILFDKLVTARWNMLRALDLENELYDLSDGKDPLCHPATVKLAELYSRYYLRFEGSFNRAYKQLKDSQTNRVCQLIEADPEAPRPTLPLADPLKIQRFAKRTPPPAPKMQNEPNSSAESEDILRYYSPDEAAEYREDAKALGVSVNYIVSQAAKYGMKRLYEDKYGNQPIPGMRKP